jgi:hypothetical protein
MMAIMGLLFLFVSGSLQAEIIHSGTSRIQLYEVGTPPIKGYWTVNIWGRRSKFLAEYNIDYKVIEEGKTFSLKKRQRLMIQPGDTPIPNPIPKMTQETCTQVNIVKDLGPVHNQVAGSCYAYAALDMLNFGTVQRYSAMHLASIQEDPHRDAAAGSSPLADVRGFYGGSISKTIALGMENGLCPEEKVPSNNKLIFRDYHAILKYYQNANKQREEIHQECLGNMNGRRSPHHFFVHLMAGMDRRNSIWDSEEIIEQVKSAYPGFKTEELKRIYGMSNNSTDFIKNMAIEACKESLEKDVPPGKRSENIKRVQVTFSENSDTFYYEDQRDALIDHINSTLTKNQPVAIAYATTGLIKTSHDDQHGFHAGVLAGRSWIPEEKNEQGDVITPAGCYYLVKNSWGEDWKAGEGMKARSSELHPGYFVISEKHLMEHTYGATSID